MRQIWTALLLSTLLTGPAFAAPLAVVQQASRTTTGTQDFTSAGFGTPVAAMCAVGINTTLGTAAAHTGVGIGFTDGTRNVSIYQLAEDAVTTTNTRRRGNTSDILHVVNNTNTVVMRIQFSSWITDGVRLNYSVAPASAYRIACTLFGGEVAQAYADSASTPATIDTGTDVTAPGFQPDVVLVINNDSQAFNDVSTNNLGMSFGFAVRNSGGNPHPQMNQSWIDITGVTTTNIQGRTSNAFAGRVGNGGTDIEIQDFDGSGFTAMTRTVGAATTFGYLALRLNGISAKALSFASPTSTGNSAVTGTGFTPMGAILGIASATSVNTTYSDGNGEAWGLAMLTSGTQWCLGASSDDGVTTSNTETVTNSAPVCLRKDGAAQLAATFSSFDSDGLTLNYGTVDASARRVIGLFFQDPTASSAVRRRVMILP
jgi:hypothetical protein